MLDSSQLQHVRASLPPFLLADERLVREFQHAASFARIPAGHDVFLEGDRVEGIALLLSGVVRVYKISETGRAITLYRFGLGQSCILSANAILSQKTFPAIATVEQDAEAVIIPSDVFRDWVKRHDAWREFVFDLLSQRLSTLMAIVDQVAFHRMDARLASFLQTRARVQNPIRITHAEIAAELGSSREVISRLLEDLSTRGLIHATRGEIEVPDAAALA
ncbi:MAG: Crp/Fnr family transcriptional regulator [Anaerolineaceae bacterium]|nr:MAG: Crp/Fnr family transcriptional regulator [Anaerolineaceae bacterium]